MKKGIQIRNSLGKPTRRHTGGSQRPEGKVTIQPELTLDALVDGITDANRYGEANTSAAVGKEVW